MSQARLAFEDCHSAAHYLNGTKEGGVEKDPTGVCGRPRVGEDTFKKYLR